MCEPDYRQAKGQNLYIASMLLTWDIQQLLQYNITEVIIFNEFHRSSGEHRAQLVAVTLAGGKLCGIM